MNDFINKTFKESDGSLKQGHEYRILRNMYNYDELGILLRWLDGRLSDDGDLPAVEFQDAHVEHFRNGYLHNDKRDENGNLIPAIVASYGTQFEYWLNGKQVTSSENG